MFRTVIKGAGAAAVLAVAVSLTACEPIQMGAAAIVGSQRISTSTLSGDVAALNAAYQANPALQSSVRYTPAQMPQLVLQWLVRFRVVDDIARHNGVQVTDAQAQRALATAFTQIERQTGTPVSPAQFAVYAAMSPNLESQWGRFQAATYNLLTFYTGAKNPSALTAAQQQLASSRFSADVTAAVKRLKIRVNPRFGRFDATQLAVSPGPPNRLSKPESA